MMWRTLRSRYVDPSVPMVEDEFRQVLGYALSNLWSDPEASTECVIDRLPVIVLLGLVTIFGLTVGSGSMLVVAAISSLIGLGVIVWSMSFPLSFAFTVRLIASEGGHVICLDCGYWMRDLPEASRSCPECGAPKDDELDLAAWSWPELNTAGE